MTTRLYRCPACKQLQKGPEGREGTWCPLCEDAPVEPVSRLTYQMLVEAEIPEEMRKALGA